MITVDVTCERVKEFKSQLTLPLDDWSRAVTVVDSLNPTGDGENRFVLLNPLIDATFLVT